MSEQQIQRKVRFFSYFPFGFCSKHATTIVGKNNPYTRITLLGKDPDAFVRAAASYHKNAVDRANNMCDKGLTKETKKMCGNPPELRIFRHLTKAGLAAITETPDQKIGALVADGYISAGNDGKIIGTYYRSNSQASADLRNTLYEYATSDTKADQNELQYLLLESVMQGQITPLATGIGQAGTVRISTDGTSQNQLYAIWRQSHIQAMFRSNDYLTCLDRKPYGPGIVIGPIRDEESYQDYIGQHGNTLPAYTYRTLTDWYRNNPGYYQITQQYPDDSDEAYLAWLHTPAFYQLNELPNAPSDNQKDANRDLLYGSKQKKYQTHVGLATGKKVNYVCYHSKPGKFKWNEKGEAETKKEMAKAVLDMKTQNPQLPYNPAVEFALMFCPTRHQFRAIFAATIKRHEKGLSPQCPIEEPYTSTHIIPVHDTGAFMLWCLMETSPESAKIAFANNLVDEDAQFHRTQNPTYPLTYKGKRVFLGHTMDIKQIHSALVDHLDGQDFYVTCFPEQVPWYRMLFPDKTFL